MGEFEDVQADRVAAGRLVVADKTFGIQRAQEVVGSAAMEARGAGDLARIQRPLRGVQRSQHLGRRDDRADRFARIAPAGITGPRSPRHRAGPLGFKALCPEGVCCRTREWCLVHSLAFSKALTGTGCHDIPAPLSSQYKSSVFYPRHSRLSDGHAREDGEMLPRTWPAYRRTTAGRRPAGARDM